MTMSLSNQYTSDSTVVIYRNRDGKRFLQAEPVVEEITKEDIKDALRDVMKQKPQQVGVNEFHILYCEPCVQEFVLFKRQTFCPICKRLARIENEDANFGYDALFQIWQQDKNFLEDILYGNKDAKLYVKENRDEEIFSDEPKDGKWGDDPLIEEM